MLRTLHPLHTLHWLFLCQPIAAKHLESMYIDTVQSSPWSKLSSTRAESQGKEKRRREGKIPLLRSRSCTTDALFTWLWNWGSLGTIPYRVVPYPAEWFHLKVKGEEGRSRRSHTHHRTDGRAVVTELCRSMKIKGSGATGNATNAPQGRSAPALPTCSPPPPLK